MKKIALIDRDWGPRRPRFGLAPSKSVFVPFFLWRERFLSEGYSFSHQSINRSPEFFTQVNDADVLICDSKIFRSMEITQVLEILSEWRKRYPWVVWFDSGDSTGNTEFAVLPFVDIYAKRQILKPSSAHLTRVSGITTHEEYYDEIFNIPSRKKEHLAPIKVEDLPKLKISWNFVYSQAGTFWRIGLLSRSDMILQGLPLPRKIPESAPNFQRPLQLSGLFTGDGNLSIHRARAAALRSISEAGGLVTQGKLSRFSYARHLEASRISISPFGWGELCYRDFEIALAGAALAKPSVAHLQTFPSLFLENETYIPLDWDPKGWGSVIGFDSETIGDLAANLLHEARQVFSGQGFETLYSHITECIFSPGYCQSCVGMSAETS